MIALVLAPLAAAPFAQETLHEARPPGVTIESEWSVRHSLVLDSLVSRMGDEEPRPIPIRMALDTTFDATLGEEVLATADDRPARVRRTYGDAELRVGVSDPEDVEAPGARFVLETPVANKSVVFVRNPDDVAGWGRHYDAEEAAEGLLPQLGVPSRLGRLLPSGPVALGDEWSVPPEVLEELVAPAGGFAWRAGEGADDQLVRTLDAGVGANLQHAFAGETTGDATASLFTVGVADGRRYAEVRLVFDVTARSDRTDFSEARALEGERQGGVEMISAKLAVRLEGTATVRWDLERHHVLGAELEGREEVEMTIRARAENDVEIEQAMRMVGTIESDMNARRVVAD